MVAAMNDSASVRKHVIRRFQGAAKADLLSAAGGRCEVCRFAPPDESMLHLHHVIPVHLGGTNVPRNTILVCPNCHAIAHWMLRTFDVAPLDRHELLERFEAMKQERKQA